MLALAAMFIAGPLALALGLASAGRTAPEPKVSGVAELAAVQVTGRVEYPDGRTAVALAPVRVWNSSRAAFVHETVTGKDGTYSLPPLDPGTYQLIFADRVRVKAHVTAAGSPGAATLDVVIPHGQAVFAEMPIDEKASVLSALAAPAAPAAASGLAASASGLLPTVAIGAGGVTAVGAVAEYYEDHYGRRRVDSP
jgi:hypothetical protein